MRMASEIVWINTQTIVQVLECLALFGSTCPRQNIFRLVYIKQFIESICSGRAQQTAIIPSCIVLSTHWSNPYVQASETVRTTSIGDAGFGCEQQSPLWDDPHWPPAQAH